MMQHSPRIIALLAALCTTAILSIGGALASNLVPQDKPAPRDVCPALCPYSSIQAAINASVEGDTIRVAGSVYPERIVVTKTVQILGGYSGPPSWQRDITAYPTIIDGQNDGTVVSLSNGSAALLEGFIIRNGNVNLDGGGILIHSASPTISATAILSNTAVSSGGGIAIDGGSPHLINDTISGNTAMGGGGILIANGAEVDLRSTTIGNNMAYMFGGGILVANSSSPTVQNTIIRGNRAPSGGGVQVFDSVGQIINSHIMENVAQSGSGGGLNIQNSSMSLGANSIVSNTATMNGGGILVETSSASIDNCLVRANQGGNGGGIYIVGSLGLITNNLIRDNIATLGSGGGIALERSAPTLDANSIIANTSATNGGGLDVVGRYCASDVCENPASPAMVNTVIARNVAGEKGGGIHVDSGAGVSLINNTIANNGGEGVFVDAYAQAAITNTMIMNNAYGIRALVPSAPGSDYNLVWSNTPGGNYEGLSAGSHDMSADPRVVSAASDDYHLRPDSPAIDSGSNAAAPGDDRDGNVRPLQGRCAGQQIADIGAYEFLLDPASCFTPTPTPTLPPGTPTRTLTPTPSSTQTASPSTTPTRTSTPGTTGTATRTATTVTSPTRTVTPTATATPRQTVAPYHLAMPVILANLLPDCAAYEPNDSQQAAWGPLTLGVTYRAYLCFYDPVDWYTVDLPRAGALSIELAVPTLMDLNLYLHSSNGALIAESVNFGEGVSERIIMPVQVPGRYYIRVAPYSRRDPNQPYTLTANLF